MSRAAPNRTETRTGSSRSPTGSDADDPFRIVGTVVDGRYLVERVVGTGGFAIVYRARHLRFDSPVALKVLHRSLRHDRGRQEEFAQRLLAEGKFLFDLGPLHWSFVRVFEMGSITTAVGVVAPYLALEWLEGATLKDEARRLQRTGSRLELFQVLSLFDGIASGLSIAHERRIAHRDIKPANIFLGYRNGKLTPRILDFGLAKAMSQSELDMDVFGDSHFAATPFTPAYGAPEQWQRRLGATGAWTDVHALALLCVELLAGQAPLLGNDSAQLMAACLDAKVRPTPRTLGVDVPDSVEAVFAKALSVDPRERPRDAGVFWQALCQAVRAAHPERQMPRLTLPLCGGSADESASSEGSNDRAVPAFTTTEAATATATSGELSAHSLKIAPVERAPSRFPSRAIVVVATLVFSGLALSALVSARSPSMKVASPAVERPMLVASPLPSAVLVETIAPSLFGALAPVETDSKRLVPAPAAQRDTVSSRKVAASPSSRAALIPPASQASSQPVEEAPPAGDGDKQPTSTKDFDVQVTERAGALDRLLLEDGLTRRK